MLSLGRARAPGRPVTVRLRPEHLRVDDAAPQLRANVAVIDSTGSLAYFTTDTDSQLMMVEQGRGRLRAGGALGLSIAPADIHLFDPDIGAAL